MKTENTYEKLQKLMNSYVPEFAYEQNGKDPGSVMTDLCGSMLEECSRRYARVVPKHQVQYLNLFDSMLKEPVSASGGYVQFQPVAGYEGMVPVPKGTSVIAEDAEGREIVFETEHSITAADVRPVCAAVTDRASDRIVVHELSDGETFTAFGLRGAQKAEHRLYLCFDEIFTWMRELDFSVSVQAVSEKDQEELLELLVSPKVRWSILEPEGSERIFEEARILDGAVHLRMEDYIPRKAVLGQKEGYYLVLSCVEEIPKLYIHTLSLSCRRERIIPEEVYVNGVEETAGGFSPFGKPLGLYNEFAFDDKEVLARKGALVKLQFHLSYRIHEEALEMPEMDLEYKAIMKKPKKPLSLRSSEVTADYVCWEYLSRTGWKRLFREEHMNSMFNGSTEGEVSLSFLCPEDMADYEEGAYTGRIRARLLQAENIYHLPAVYRCPVISALMLSYSYEEHEQYASYAVTRNNFEEKDVTAALQAGGNMTPFYQTQHGRRAMYLGFDRTAAGTPFSLYFDIENYSDRPVDFQVEYLSERGFQTVKLVDHTGGFCGAGNMLLMIPQDMKNGNLFGKEGFWLRFLSYNRENPEHALPVIRGIYPNMAQVANVNTVTEEFYLDNHEDAVDIQLSQQNLLKAAVWVRETGEEGPCWIQWKKAERSYEGGRTCQIDMVEGTLHFRKNTFVNYPVTADGPQIRVEHSNYTGSAANLPAGAIHVAGEAIRYISGVINPFPTYGGYDGYTEDTAMRLVTGMLRTRNRAVTSRDFFDIISQVSYGVRRVKCCSGVNAAGEDSPGSVTVAVLMEEYEKGAHVFSRVKRSIRDRLEKDSALIPMGRSIHLIQPHFVKLNVRVWLEKESMEQAYEMQHKAQEIIEQFIDPLNGGIGGKGWEIGEFPRVSQVIACLRTGIAGCNISKIVMTVLVDGSEIPVTDEFYEKVKNPFLMAVNGEHMVYIEVSAC